MNDSEFDYCTSIAFLCVMVYRLSSLILHVYTMSTPAVLRNVTPLLHITLAVIYNNSKPGVFCNHSHASKSLCI